MLSHTIVVNSQGKPDFKPRMFLLVVSRGMFPMKGILREALRCSIALLDSLISCALSRCLSVFSAKYSTCPEAVRQTIRVLSNIDIKRVIDDQSRLGTEGLIEKETWTIDEIDEMTGILAIDEIDEMTGTTGILAIDEIDAEARLQKMDPVKEVGGHDHPNQQQR